MASIEKKFDAAVTLIKSLPKDGKMSDNEIRLCKTHFKISFMSIFLSIFMPEYGHIIGMKVV